MEMTKLETLNARCALRIHAATFAKEARSVGIVAAETQSNAGVLAREIAVITAGFGRKVMLINARETSDSGVQGKTVAEFVSNAVVGIEGILEVRILRGSEAHRALRETDEHQSSYQPCHSRREGEGVQRQTEVL